MLKSTHYELNLMEGTDLMNPLIIDRPNYEKIDEVMYNNAQTGIQTATELYDSGLKVHALSLSKESSVFRFVATSAYTSGDTFTVNGKQVTALLPSGEALSTGAYVINSTVLCALNGTLLTLYLAAGTVALANDSNRLGGELPDFYASAVALQATTALAESASRIANDTAKRVGMDIIWRNASGDQAFQNQRVVVNLTLYRFVIIYYRNSITDYTQRCTIIPVSGGAKGIVENIGLLVANRIYSNKRVFELASDLSNINFFDCVQELSSPYTNSVSNNECIPTMIVGIK